MKYLRKPHWLCHYIIRDSIRSRLHMFLGPKTPIFKP